MADPEIERWNNSGTMLAWHYDGFPRNYCGYHLMADVKGCHFLKGLIERFQNARYPARKKVSLAIPTAEHLAVPNCPKTCLPAGNIEFRFRRELDREHWTISEVSGEVVIEMGAAGLCEIDRGVADMMRGDGDWAIGDDSNALWFWWHPNTRRTEQRSHAR